MSMVYELLTGTVDGSNVTFTSTQIPEWGSLHVFDDGVEVTVTSFTDTTITLAVAPATGSQVFAVYNVKPNEETALDLITDAMMEIGIASLEDSIEIGDANLGLRYLNRLIDSSNIEPGAIFVAQEDVLTMIADQQDYTIGVDPAGILVANFNVVRPTKIKSIVLRIQSTPSIVRDRPMSELDADQWAEISLLNSSSVPDTFYYKADYPLATIKFNPAPSAAYVIELASWKQASRIANLYDVVQYPPGYRDYYMYRLARRLCGPFGRPLTEHLVDMERRAIQAVESHNCKSPLLGTDPALTGRNHYFNWMTGE